MDFLETVKEALNFPQVSMILTLYEQKQRELKDEFIIKKTQVTNLRAELDQANLKNNELTRELENLKGSLNEKTKNLNLALQTIQSLESKLQERSGIASKMQLQRTVMDTEKSTIKEDLIETKRENYELKHKIEDFQAQHESDVAYQNEFRNDYYKIQTLITNVKSELKNVEDEHQKLSGLYKEIKTGEELVKSLTYCNGLVENEKKKNETLQKQLIIANAKYNKLTELLNNDPLQELGKQKSNFIFKQWQESLTFHKEQIDIQNATIEKLREKFEEEKEINIDLILKLNDIEKQNTELTQALDAFKNIERTDCETQTIPENNDTNDAAEVKQEVIELE